MNLPFNRRYGGANKSNRLLAQELAKKGHEVVVVTPALAVPSDFTLDELLDDLRSEGVDVLNTVDEYIYLSSSVNVVAVKKPENLSIVLKDRIYKLRPDWILVSSEDPSQILLKSALDISPNNVLYLCHTHYMLPFGRLSLYPGEERTKLFTKVKSVITISDYMKNYVKEYLDVDVFCNYFSHYTNSKRVGSINNKYVLMINPSSVKGIDILLELAFFSPDINFAVINGWGTTPTDIKRIKRYKNITFLESTNDLNGLFSEVSVLLMPSIWEEGFGISALDALSRGVPVISSKLGGLPEAKVNTNYQIEVNPILYFKEEFDENNFPIAVYEKQDITNWKKALDELINDPIKYKQESDLSFNNATEFIENLSVQPLIDYLVQRSTSKGGFDSLTGAQKLELLKKVKNKKLESCTPLDQISSLPKQDVYDISFAQKQLLRLDEMTSEHYGSILTHFYLHNVAIDMEILLASVDKLVMKHENLRTRFIKVEGEYKQKIEKNIDVNLVVEHISLIHNIDQVSVCKKCIENVVNQRFDLNEIPLFKLLVIEIEQEKVLFVLAMHHIISDGVSMQVFIKELNTFYNCFLHNEITVNEELNVQYKDFAHWQNEYFSQEKLNKEKLYWHTKLSGKLPKIDLPIDFPRPKQKTFRGKRTKITILDEHVTFIDKFNKQNNSTLFITLLAFIKLLIFKYSNQNDLIVGTPVANRDSNSNQIGYYVNMIALRNNIDSNNTFIEYLDKIKNNCIEAYENSKYPFDLLIDELVTEHDLSRSPIFDILISMSDEDTSEDLVDSEKSEFLYELEKIIQPGSSHDLAFIIQRKGKVVDINITFNTDLFLESTIDSIGKHLLTLISNIAENQNIFLKDIMLVDNREIEEMRELLTLPSIGKENVTIITRFEQIVSIYPNNIACSLGDDFITYQGLNIKINQFANVLRNLDVNSNKLVAVMMEPSIEFIVSIFAVLKSGGGYLPIDPNLPQKRIDYILQDSQCTMVITKKEIDSLSSITTISYDNLSFENKYVDNLPMLNAIDDLAYVIYTSGTTGLPKGVRLKHSNLMSLLLNLPDMLSITAEDKWGLLHSISFDFSIWEIFGAILHGSELVMAPLNTVKDPVMLCEFLVQKEITILNQVPGAFYNLSNEVIDSKQYKFRLRYIIFGGDSLVFSRLKNWKERYPDVKLVNMYGITETSIHVTYKEILEEDISSNISNIGVPLKNGGIFILDDFRKPVPKGFVGELYIFGLGVGDGYINKEDLTKDRFITIPILSNSSIFYKSGDFGRYLDNGDIEFIGRKDNQVQIRGHRVELGELDYRMELCPFVKEYLVLTQTDLENDNIIVVYFVLKEIIADFKTKIKEYLMMYLPEYMIPQVFIQIEKIPLTFNGKLDKDKLPKFEKSIDIIEPSTDIEDKLFEIWKEVLGHDNFGIENNFFDIGGHSLKAAKVTNLIYKKFQIEIKLGIFFDHPTIKELAEYIMYLGFNDEDDNMNQNYIVL
jgi:amino acid adenylation domain-containing protein